MPGQNTKNPYDYTGKVFFITPAILESMHNAGLAVSSDATSSQLLVQEENTGRHMLCIYTFYDRTGKPGASVWLPLQTNADSEIPKRHRLSVRKCPWSDPSSTYKYYSQIDSTGSPEGEGGTLWLLGAPGSPFSRAPSKGEPFYQTEERTITSCGLREVQRQIKCITIPESWMKVLYPGIQSSSKKTLVFTP